MKIMKRNKTKEEFSIEKLNKQLELINVKEPYKKILVEAVTKKLFDGITTEQMQSLLIDTAVNHVSRLALTWDQIARDLLIIKLKKDFRTATLKGDDFWNYPDYKGHLTYMIGAGKYINIYEYFNEEEIDEISKIIVPERDKEFNLAGLTILMDKYSISANGHYLELPQHILLRVAIAGFINSKNKEARVKNIKRRYDDLSKFYFTEATPKMLNALTKHNQLSSCVLTTVGDTTESLLNTATTAGIYSKHSGGMAIDISAIRATGSEIKSSGGKSDGVVPFIRMFENTVAAFNQGGKRKGSAVISFPFWHLDVMSILVLKDNGGSPDTRARKLQYAIKWYKVLSERIKTDSYITLFDPKEVPLLLTTSGEEFKAAYEKYEQSDIRKKKIKAHELAFLIAKTRAETGNLYITFIDNVNNNIAGDRKVFSSNLCQEVMLPSFPSNETQIGNTALCNLSSINLTKYWEMTGVDKNSLIRNLLEASYYFIQDQAYLTKEAKQAAIDRPAIGIGVNNYANFLAKHTGFKGADAKKITEEVFEDLSYRIYSISNKLANVYGAYKEFSNSGWSRGEFPNSNSTDPKWVDLKKRIMKSGVLFSYHIAIAPTATSGQIINSTEGIEPVRTLIGEKEGSYTVKVIQPNINEVEYDNAFDIGNKNLIELAAIRQKYIDQGQSFSLYYPDVNSAYDIINDTITAEEAGLKSLYYLHSKKLENQEECESCSS